MLKELLKIYEDGLVNPQAPECLFAETLIFNEGWLLRSILSEWRTRSESARLGFLPFPEGVKIYSEGQLYTPFKARERGDKLAEANTRADGIAGDFSIQDTKSGIVVNSDFRYIAVFEAKMYGRISGGTKNAPWYDQVSRTAACLINSIVLAKPKGSYAAHLAVLYPEDNDRINRDLYTKTHIENQISERLRPFMEKHRRTDGITRFADGWRHVLDSLEIGFHTWEEVLAEIGNDDLDRFYRLCERFNR